MRNFLGIYVVGLLAIAEVAGAQTTTAPSEPVKAATSWADKTTIKGDVRFRHETIDEDGKDTRNRERIRARIGAFAKPTVELDVGIQFSTTENNDPLSSNQTLGDGGSRKNAYFDLIYMDFHPESLPGLRAVAGKMEMPFIRVSDLVYDNDYNPEGAALKYKFGENIQFFLNGANFWLEERAEEDETTMAGLQAAVKLQNEDASYVQAGVSWYQFENMKGFAPLFDDAKGAKGNSTDKIVDDGTTSVVYATEFTIPEIFAEAWMNSDIPFGLYGNYVINDEADDEDTGYLVGLKVGKAKDPGSFDFDYNWRHVENDSVVGQMTDSDSFGGGTDGEGHRFSLGYQIAKNLKGTATYFMDEKAISKDAVDYDRLQVDFVGKF